MKITVVSFYLPPIDRIGAGVQMHMLANAYVDLGHKVTVVAPVTEKDVTARYDLEPLKIYGDGRIIKWSLALAKHNFDSDIVHFGGDDHWVLKNREFVHIRTFHGSCFAEAQVARKVADKVRMVYLGMTELLAQRVADISSVVSTDTNRYFPRANVVIPNGVDLQSFSPSVTKSEIPSILFVGTLDSRKRGRVLLNEFVENVRPRFPNSELWLVRESGSVDIPGVKVFGSLAHERLVELYQKAWVFCLPSSYEGFGVPYIEAMACGTPVVATPNPGALEVLDHGRHGLITDIDQLGHALVSLLSDQRKRADLAIAGLERARDFDIHKIAQNYIDLACNFTKKRDGR